MVFNGKTQNPRLATEIVNRAMEFTFYASTCAKTSSRIIIQVRWEKPPAGWFKLNTDGASGSGMDRLGCGGIIRDEHGCWITGFSRRIGAANSIIAELWGLRDGLQLCCCRNFGSIEVEIDAKAILDSLLNPNYVNYIVSPLLEDCKTLATRFRRICFKHCFREVNCCADKLASLGSSQSLDFIIYQSLPVDTVTFLEEDASGMYRSRLCSVSSVS